MNDSTLLASVGEQYKPTQRLGLLHLDLGSREQPTFGKLYNNH
jgi:hypothetical protein